MDLDIILGKKLQALRNEKSLKQIDVAERIGVTRFTISRLENGKHHTSDLIIKALCDVYDVDYTMLMIDVLQQIKSNETKH